MKLGDVISTTPSSRTITMKRTRTLIKTLLVFGPMTVALSALASNSSYASASVASVCPPNYDNHDSGCAYLYPYGFYGDAGDWWRHDHWRRGDDHGVERGSDHGGFGHSSFGHGGIGHGGGGHGR